VVSGERSKRVTKPTQEDVASERARLGLGGRWARHFGSDEAMIRVGLSLGLGSLCAVGTTDECRDSCLARRDPPRVDVCVVLDFHWHPGSR
jgi:hypothetical protein